MRLDSTIGDHIFIIFHKVCMVRETCKNTLARSYGPGTRTQPSQKSAHRSAQIARIGSQPPTQE